MDTATQQIENVEQNNRRAAEFDKALAVGHLVGVNWTESFVSYSGRARVLKLNAKSVVTELVAPIEDGRTVLHETGDRITVPRIADGKRWSINNCVTPFPRLWGVLVESDISVTRKGRVVGPLAYNPAVCDLLGAPGLVELRLPIPGCVGIASSARATGRDNLPMLIVRERRCATCYWTGIQSADVPRIEAAVNIVVTWEGFAATDLVSL